MVEDAYISLIRKAYQDFELGDLDLLRGGNGEGRGVARAGAQQPRR